MDDYNVQLLVPTVGSVPTHQEPGYHTWPRIRTVCAVALDLWRRQPKPKLTPERSFLSYSGQANTKSVTHLWKFVLNYHNLFPPVRLSSCCNVDSLGSMPNWSRPYRARTTSRTIEGVTLWVQLTDQTFTTLINRNFAQKVRRRKCDPLGPVDIPDFHNFVLIEILLKKVRL